MNEKNNCSYIKKMSEPAYALLRAVTGFIFLYHGWSKAFGEIGIFGFTGMLEGLNVPLAELVSYLVAYGELLGGLALILGILTRWASTIFITIMLGAIFLIHISKGYDIMHGGYEYQLLILVLGFFFLANGGGKYSLDTRLKSKSISTETNDSL